MSEVITWLEKANVDLEPELLSVSQAREELDAYAKAQRLVAFGVAALARKIDEASSVAKVTGTSVGKAKETIATGKVLGSSGELTQAMQHGEVSLDQAAEIAKAEEAAPGAATDLLTVAREQSFHVLREKARKTKLEAERHGDLFSRQRAARCARTYSDGLGMVHIDLALEPHVGTRIVARAEAEAARLAKKARTEQGGPTEPFERYLADAYASLLSDSRKGSAKRPELVVLISHEMAKRAWSDVREGEYCSIRSRGWGPSRPMSPRR